MGFNEEHWLPPRGMVLPSVPSIPRNPGWAPPINSGAAGGSIVKRKTNQGERIRAADVADAAV